jgi:uncharacterized protein
VSTVSNLRKPLRLNVGFLINSTIGINREFFFEAISVTSEDGLVISDIEGKAKISRTPQGLFVEGDFSGTIPLTCVRCLCDYTQSLRWEFDELFAFSRDNITDSDLLVPDDAHIDLHSLVHDFAFVEVPIKPVCKPDCKGLCVECGQNLNERDCGHRPKSDTPFAALKDLLNKDEL